MLSSGRNSRTIPSWPAKAFMPSKQLTPWLTPRAAGWTGTSRCGPSCGGAQPLMWSHHTSSWWSDQTRPNGSAAGSVVAAP